jgi:hypothetical protein
MKTLIGLVGDYTVGLVIVTLHVIAIARRDARALAAG